MYRLIEAEHFRDKQILVVGGGDSAVEAALALSRQPGNRVTISYRKQEFRRIKQRNAQLISECISRGTIDVIFKSTPVEFNSDAVVLQIGGSLQTIGNDFVWIFAGGAPSYEFLNKIGVACGPPDSAIVRQTAENLPL
jgi:thioredoxin reductase